MWCKNKMWRGQANKPHNTPYGPVHTCHIIASSSLSPLKNLVYQKYKTKEKKTPVTPAQTDTKISIQTPTQTTPVETATTVKDTAQKSGNEKIYTDTIIRYNFIPLCPGCNNLGKSDVNQLTRFALHNNGMVEEHKIRLKAMLMYLWAAADPGKSYPDLRKFLQSEYDDRIYKFIETMIPLKKQPEATKLMASSVLGADFWKVFDTLDLNEDKQNQTDKDKEDMNTKLIMDKLNEFKTEITELRTELRREIQKLDERMTKLESTQTIVLKTHALLPFSDVTYVDVSTSTSASYPVFDTNQPLIQTPTTK
jgi:hypothetical protein